MTKTVRNLLTRGNGKLGEGIHAWSIPAIETCPGRSALCERVGYAREGRFRTQFMQDRLAENLDAAADLEVAGYWCAEQAPRSVRLCHHLHGGIGMDVTYPLHRFSSLVADLIRFLGGAALPCSST